MLCLYTAYIAVFILHILHPTDDAGVENGGDEHFDIKIRLVLGPLHVCVTHLFCDRAAFPNRDWKKKAKLPKQFKNRALNSNNRFNVNFHINVLASQILEFIDYN